MKTSERVENILKVSHKARNSDKELLILFMQKFGLNLSEEQVTLFRMMPSMETIRRCRQALQEKGLYPADETTDELRYTKYVQMKHRIRDENPDKILNYTILPWGT